MIRNENKQAAEELLNDIFISDIEKESTKHHHSIHSKTQII